MFQNDCLYYHLKRINLTYVSAQGLRDALALRYCKPLLNLPGTCDGCGATFTVDHALDCRFGGLVTRRHNEVRDAVGYLASLVWNPVRHEPIVKEAGDDDRGALIADLAILGVWQPQCEAIFDIGNRCIVIWLPFSSGCLTSFGDGQEVQVLSGL